MAFVFVILQGQSDTDSPDVELNSATEISTDSEFDHDPIQRDPPPKILIDNSYLKNSFKPSRFQVCAIFRVTSYRKF